MLSSEGNVVGIGSVYQQQEMVQMYRSSDSCQQEDYVVVKANKLMYKYYTSQDMKTVYRRICLKDFGDYISCLRDLHGNGFPTIFSAIIGSKY